MMSSQSTVIDPVFRSKMPLFDGAIASTGLSKPKNMPGFLGKQALQYSGAYFTYDPRAKDGAGFTPDWNNSKNSLLDDRSPVNQLSGMEGENHIIYRQDGNSAEIGHSHTSPMSHIPIKQGFTPYTKNREISSPTAATVAVRKQKTAENSSPASENLVYLAIPKPVYGHNPCCNEVSCVIGQRYAVEHGSQRIQSTVYEHDWMQTDAHYSERPPIQRKVQDTLLQQRGVQFEHGAERLKRMTVETYSQSRARTLPAVIEPNYSSYPCTPTHTHFGSLNEQSQHLQTPSRGYPSLYSSHPTYEHMTSELYRERSHMSKYGQLTQHPMFYYPQANVEVEKRTQCKDIGGKQREDVPVILKHTMSSPRDHYAVPQSLRSEIPLHLPSTETMSNHSFIQGYDYPCYAVPRFNLNASQIRAPLKRQHASPSWHFNRINVSSSGQHGDHPVASVAKDKPDTSLHVDQSHTSSPFLLVDQTSPIRCVGQPGVSPPSIQMNRFFPSLTSQHIDRPILAPAGLNMDRLLDCSCEAQVMCSKQPKDHSVSPVSWLPQSPNHSSDRIPTAVTNGPNVRKMIYSPAAATGNKHNGPTSSSATSVLKGSLKRSVSHSSPPMKIKEEDQDLCEVDLIKKRQKMEMENVQVRNQTNSPPMPIIDNVFSLAPYQPYLQASGVLFSGGVHPRSVQSSEHCEVKPKPFIKEKRPDRDQQPVVRAASKNICPDTPTERPVVDLFKTQNIKVEKIDPPDTDNSVESFVGQKDCSKITIKEEPEDTDLNDDGLMLVIKKCESDELENKPSLTDVNETSDESKPVEVTAQITTPSQGDTSTPHDQVVSPHSKPIVTSQPPETKLNFKNIPRQCLKLSAYKIILPDMNSCTVPPQEKPPVEPTAEIIPKLELQMPVRKHFSELHHSLCKLVSKSVSASSEQKLRTWLSQLELTQPASPLTKVQKVSCLLGIKAREVWLNEEMKSALHKVLERLREYTAQERCPFPHVMRTGAVFVPMLVVKELLFSMVQGSFIDQVLQEHKVELRPTTLSEEKILIQLHKRACSSRLRKLMSLKHLPDIYADVLNLLYYTSVCKHLGLEMGDSVNRQQDGCEESNESPDITASPASPSPAHPQRHLQDDETKLHLSRNRTKSRVKSSSRRLFLDSSLSDKEEADDTEKTESGGGLNTSSKKNTSGHQCEEAENGGNDRLVAEEDSCENSWMCPLTYDDLLQSSGDTAIETPSSLDPVCHSSGQAEFQLASQSCSGVILKLRRMFSEGLNRKKACYQAVSDSFTDPSLSQEEDVEGKRNSEGDFHTRTPKVNHRWQRTGSLSRTLRPLGSSSKRKHRSLLKIKYCPYLSACHSAEHRRRWVLRSAVQRARRDMRFYYPDLVGKRIRHLYEEDDKSEVWYRGEVLRIHEAHTNPLKTIFEVRYDSEPEWKYYLELLIDYKKGWLKIED